MHHGHYYALVKSQGKWINFNDTDVKIVEDKDTHMYYGMPPTTPTEVWPCAYMLLYESEEILAGLQIRK